MIPVVEAPVPAGTRMSRAGFVLLGGLLFLRLPFLVIASMLKFSLAGTVYYIGTYLLTLPLIWVERARLREYHIGPAAVTLIAAAPLLDQAFFQAIRAIAGRPMYGPASLPVRWIELAPGLILLAALAIKGFPGPREGRRIWAWAAAAVPIGAVMAIFLGLAGRLQMPQVGNTAVPFATLAICFVIQLTRAATYEEPLFRGFLWGYLRQRGWKDLQICLFQASLFWLGHLYYFPELPASFWLIVPSSALVLGLLSWRSRSIIPGMIVHGIINGTAIFIARGMLL